MKKLENLIKNFIPTCEQEIEDKKYFLNAIKTYGNYSLMRENEICHFTSSAFVLNKAQTKIICIYHNLYNSWGWVGGHADGDSDLLYVAIKETIEETSAIHIKPLMTTPISIEKLPVFEHIKKGKTVKAHYHLNVTFLLIADEHDELKILPSENSNVAWLTFDELTTKASEPHMIIIYKKIINKIQKLSK